MTLNVIKRAIGELSEEDKASLVAWLNEQDARAWDKQIEADFSEGGDGAAMLEAWDAEIKAAKTMRLEEFLRQRDAAHRPK